MNLSELIQALREEGNQFNSWSGIETNVESVKEATRIDGIWTVELKLKEEKK